MHPYLKKLFEANVGKSFNIAPFLLLKEQGTRVESSRGNRKIAGKCFSFAMQTHAFVVVLIIVL